VSWVEVSPDGRHRIFRCSECRRFGVTGAVPGYVAPGREALGQCVCKKGAGKR